jgi:hypothetical protein
MTFLLLSSGEACLPNSKTRAGTLRTCGVAVKRVAFATPRARCR